MVNGMDYTEEQCTAISHAGGNLQLIACAGSGKTEVVSRRISMLLRRGIAPESIVAFTFTEKAAAELKERVLRHVEQDLGTVFSKRIGELFVGTIHGYCLRLLQENGEFNNFDALTEHTEVALLGRFYNRLGLPGLLERSFPGQKIPRYKGIDIFRRSAEVVYNDLLSRDLLKSKTPLFHEILTHYEELLSQMRLINFAQMIAWAVDMIERHPAVQRRLAQSVRHLVVDEYQDINPAQEKVIRLLHDLGATICVVGDDDQSIYQWRGTDVSNIVTFTGRYPSVSSVTLEKNFRSTPGIVDVANHIARSIPKRLPKRMVTALPDDGLDRCFIECASEEDEAEWIIHAIELFQRQGYQWGDMAILLRSVSTSGGRFLRKLREKNVPVVVAGKVGLFQRPEIRFLGELVARWTDQEWRDSTYDKSTPVRDEVLRGDLAQIFSGRVRDESTVLRDLLAIGREAVTSPRADLVRTYQEILAVLGIENLDADNERERPFFDSFGKFSQLLTDFEHMRRRAAPLDTEDRAKGLGVDRISAIHPAGMSLWKGLHWYIQTHALDSYEEGSSQDTSDMNAVHLMTVHQAKGLEFPIVFVPCLVDKRFPSKRTGEKRNWLIPANLFDRTRYEGRVEDELRLFYVALTRAKRILILSRFTRYARQRANPSPFLADLLRARKIGFFESEGKIFERTVRRQMKKQEPLLTSFSDLSVYEACPYGYRLRLAHGFQPPLAPELGYGKSLHHVITCLAREARRGRSVSRQTVDRIVDDQFYLPLAGRAGKEQMKTVAKRSVGAYVEKFGTELQRAVETEARFEVPLGNAIVRGKIDLVADLGQGPNGGLRIVEFKTKLNDGETPDPSQVHLYCLGAESKGWAVTSAFVHDLHGDRRHPVSIEEEERRATLDKVEELSDGIRDGNFHPKPGPHCRECDHKRICRHAAVR